MRGVNRDYNTSIIARDIVEVKVVSKRTHKARVQCRFRLRLEDSADTFYRRTPAQRLRTKGVCWHGSTLFMARLFAAYPMARIKTAHVGYSGADNFRQKGREVELRQLGTDIAVEFQRSCDCHESLELILRVTLEFPWDQRVI